MEKLVTIRKYLILSYLDKYFNLIVSFISITIISRILTPADIGLYAVATAFIGITQALRDFGIFNYIVREKHLTPERLGTAIVVSLFLGIILMTAFWFAAEPLAIFYNNHELVYIIRLQSINFILISYAAIGTALLMRDLNYKMMTSINMASAIIGATSSITLASNGLGAIALAWGSVIAVAMIVVVNTVFVGSRILIRPSLIAWREILHFGAFASGASMLRIFSSRIPDMVIGKILGFESAGLFSRGNSLITLFEQALMGGLSSVTNGVFAAHYRENKELTHIYLRILRLVTGVAWPFLLLLAIGSSPLILILFGHQWKASVPIAQIMCAATALSTVGVVSYMLFTAVGKVRVIFQIEVKTTFIILFGVLVGSFFSLQWCAVGFLVSSTSSSILYLRATKQDFAIPPQAIYRAVAPSAFVAMITGFIPTIMLLTTDLNDDQLFPFALYLGVSGLLSWLVALRITRHDLMDEITNIAKELLNRIHRRAR